MGKYVDKRLEELGGERVFELGLGDDDGKYVEILNKPYIYKKFLESLGVEALALFIMIWLVCFIFDKKLQGILGSLVTFSLSLT